ncbi:MAG: AEC family transporter [Oscillospiraceae bacterium]|nr:AEC family transporter [Oscillospiraceae bacterium]
MHITVIIEQMGKLFLILCLGFALARIELLDQHTKQKLTKILLNVTTPLMMIDAFYDRMQMLGEQESDLSVSVGMLFVYSFAFYLILIVLSLILVAALHPPKDDKRLYIFMTIFGNVGFMGFPIVKSVYGTEGLFYAAIVNSVFNIFVYTFGVVLMGGAGESGSGSLAERIKQIPWKKLLLTPAVIGTAVGILIFVCRIPLPGIIADTCGTLGDLTSPLAMLVVGANLSGMKIKDVLTNMRMNIYVLLRQIAMPLVFWLIISRFVTHPVLAPTLLLMSCMPVANTTALFATEYNGNEKLASQGIFMTTLFSLLSFPLIIWICVK